MIPQGLHFPGRVFPWQLFEIISTILDHAIATSPLFHFGLFLALPDRLRLPDSFRLNDSIGRAALEVRIRKNLECSWNRFAGPG
jgi:hypothetical protein